MKTKTDLYTKIVLTIIAIFLGILIFKDVDFITKAQASELNLSGLKIEQATDDEGTTFFIYENSKLERPFSDDEKSRHECYIKASDVPTYIITNIIVDYNKFSSGTKIKKTDY